MDEKLHAAFSGANVIMNKRIKGKFDLFDGYCSGYNIELIDGEKNVQAWHFLEDGCPEDHYSICTFKFRQIGIKSKLNFTQTRVPVHKVEELKGGWKDVYWDPMKTYLKTGMRKVATTEKTD